VCCCAIKDGGVRGEVGGVDEGGEHEAMYVLMYVCVCAFAFVSVCVGLVACGCVCIDTHIHTYMCAHG